MKCVQLNTFRSLVRCINSFSSVVGCFYIGSFWRPGNTNSI